MAYINLQLHKVHPWHGVPGSVVSESMARRLLAGGVREVYQRSIRGEDALAGGAVVTATLWHAPHLLVMLMSDDVGNAADGYGDEADSDYGYGDEADSDLMIRAYHAIGLATLDAVFRLSGKDDYRQCVIDMIGDGQPRT